MSGCCPYCMEVLSGDGPCPGCGKEPGDYRPSSHHFPPNTLLQGRYLVGRVLGEGGFGITYLGLDTDLERRVAIKEYFPTCFVGRETALTLDVTCYTKSNQEAYERGREKFLQEARVMARLDHVAEIVGVLDHFEANNTAYIVMEFLEGETLKDLTARRGPIPAGEMLEMLRPVLRAMEAMHRAGIIHRDISPDNLMVMKKGTVKLMDFGCAKDIEGQQTKTVTLKHGFAPREQYSGRGQGPWTDVYALCATVYYCLTGKVPPRATERGGDDPLVPPGRLGADLTSAQEEALLRGLAVRAGDRWQSAAALYAALYGVTMDGIPCVPQEDEDGKEDGDAAASNESGEERREPSPVRRRLSKKARAGIAAAVCALVLIGAAVPLLRSGAPAEDSIRPNQSQQVGEDAGKTGEEDRLPEDKGGGEEGSLLPDMDPETTDPPSDTTKPEDEEPTRQPEEQPTGSAGTEPAAPPQQTQPAVPTEAELAAQADSAAANGQYTLAANAYRQMQTLGYLSAGELGQALNDLGSEAALEQEYEVSVALYEEAVTLGNQSAKRGLAIHYEYGTGVPRSYEKAFQLNLELAQAGYSGASVYYDVADAYTEGVGTARDPQQAIYWWERYLETGDAKGDTVEKIQAKIEQLRQG